MGKYMELCILCFLGVESNIVKSELFIDKQLFKNSVF